MGKTVLIQDIPQINRIIRLRKNMIKNLHYILFCDIFFIRYFIRSMNEYGVCYEYRFFKKFKIFQSHQ